MYISDDNIILNDFEKKAVEQYCFKELSKFSKLRERDFIHEYDRDLHEEGLNVFYDGTIKFFWKPYDGKDILVCFDAKIKKDSKGCVKRGDQKFLSNHQGNITIRGGEYEDKTIIQQSKEYKEIIKILDEVYCNVWNTEGSFAYYFGNGGLKLW